MFHELIKIWFQWVDQWGYWGVFVLMAMESSIFPVPSEIVIPPAAFWAAQGRMSFWGVVLAGTTGSYFGSAVTYLIAQWAGAPLVKKYGKYFFLSDSKLELAESWIKDYGLPGIFIARLMPVVRHLISIPAGIFKMPFVAFSVVTTIGAGLWCTVLAWFGGKAIGEHPELLQSPEQLSAVIKSQLAWFIAAIVLIGALYGVVVAVKIRRTMKEA